MAVGQFFAKLGPALASTAAVATVGILAALVAPVAITHHLDKKKQRKNKNGGSDGCSAGEYRGIQEVLGKKKKEEVIVNSAEQENKNSGGFVRQVSGLFARTASGVSGRSSGVVVYRAPTAEEHELRRQRSQQIARQEAMKKY